MYIFQSITAAILDVAMTWFARKWMAILPVLPMALEMLTQIVMNAKVSGFFTICRF